MENSDPYTVDTAEAGNGKREIVLQGLPASGGIAIGPVFLYEREEVYVIERVLDERMAEREVELYKRAIARAEEELRASVSASEQNLNEEATAIFESQIQLLLDAEVQKIVEKRILTEKRNADFIIQDEFRKFKALLMNGASQFQERALDIDDVCSRLIRNLQRRRLKVSLDGPHVVIAENLTPADTILFNISDVLGYVTEFGGLTSHAAILARSFKLPAIAGLHNITAHVSTGDLVIVDGQRGKLFIHPTEERQREYQEKADRIKALENKLSGLAELPCITPDGHKVELSANAEFTGEVEYILAQGAKGIGLYRTEHLYIDKGDFPSEQEQYLTYAAVATMVYPHSVIFRTFDIGGDKFLISEKSEANPFLGWRGSRVMLDKPEIFQQQLRAILRASAKKNVKIMFPMISGVMELREAKAQLQRAKDSLRAEGVPFDDEIESGIMIEVPSAVIIADDLAKEVDFFSIGTNDLIQYLLAVDRNNDLISDLYEEFHPAVLRAVRHVIETGHENNIWVGMCGEMAGNPLATVFLLGLGLDEFSLVPSVLPEIKEIIRTTKYEDARLVVSQALSYGTADEIRAFLRAHVREHYPDIYESIRTNGGGNNE